MNVLLEALEGVSNLIPYKAITIIMQMQEIANGFPVVVDEELNTFAHIQPLTPFEVKKLTDSTLDSGSYFKFYILEDLANVLNALQRTSAKVKFDDRYFNVFSKNDWSENGWIQVIGAEYNHIEEEEEDEDV